MLPATCVVVCEAEADARISCGLADRVLCEQIEWLESEHLGACRRYRGYEPNQSFLRWDDAKKLARKKGIRAHGKFSGEVGAPEAGMVRRTLLLIHGMDDVPDAVMLIRDDDRKSERRTGFDQAIAATPVTFRVVVGIAHVNRECWVLAGFEPCDDAESNALQSERSRLGYDPVTEAHRLLSGHKFDNSAKKVLATLTDGVVDRQEVCWKETALEQLRSRGKTIGLSDFLEAVKTDWVPVISGRR